MARSIGAESSEPVEQPEYRIERITPEAYPHLVTLMRRCFDTAPSLDRVRSKFNTAAFGAANIGYIAYAIDGEPAAYYGVFPVRVRLAGGDHLAAQSGDTMTDPAHQKKGLFIRLAMRTYELAQANGVRFIFGFPNENSRPGFERRLTWRFTGHLQDYRLTARIFPLCELAHKFKVLQPLYLRLIERRSRALKADGPLFIDGGPISICIRDEGFYSYKEAMGARWIVVHGVRMLVKPEVHLYVGEILFGEGMDPYRLRRALLHAAKKFLCRRIICTFSTTHPLYGFMSRVSSPEEGLPIGHLDLGSALPISDLAYSRADLDTF
ncbi:MAG: GNAT family N-acetyltransferase [Flavobacteriales bacterium]|nr:GNAT family N-acetyltransferase [Flavobacteriales bacterium]